MRGEGVWGSSKCLELSAVYQLDSFTVRGNVSKEASLQKVR